MKSAYCLTSGKDEFLNRENQLKLDPDGFSKDYRFNSRLKNPGSISETYLWFLNLFNMARVFLMVIFLNSVLYSFSQQKYRDSIFLFQDNYKKELSSVIQNDTSYVRFHKPDHSYCIMAKVERLSGEKVFKMGTSGGITKEAQKIARIHFVLNDRTYVLYGYQLLSLRNDPKYQTHFFIPFTDRTSGEETYGGGRYLDFTLENISASEGLELDFNKAYNPYCAFKSGYNCPIPPRENNLSVSIKAGEKNFARGSAKK